MTVKIERTKLLEIIQANFVKHKEIVTEAFARYRELAIQELDAMLEEAKTGKRIRRSLNLTQPIDQTREYTKAIRQLELSTDDVIELAEHEFECYVMDRWAWKSQFSISNSAYTTKAAQIEEDNG